MSDRQSTTSTRRFSFIRSSRNKSNREDGENAISRWLRELRGGSDKSKRTSNTSNNNSHNTTVVLACEQYADYCNISAASLACSNIISSSEYHHNHHLDRKNNAYRSEGKGHRKQNRQPRHTQSFSQRRGSGEATKTSSNVYSNPAICTGKPIKFQEGGRHAMTRQHNNNNSTSGEIIHNGDFVGTKRYETDWCHSHHHQHRTYYNSKHQYTSTNNNINKVKSVMDKMAATDKGGGNLYLSSSAGSKPLMMDDNTSDYCLPRVDREGKTLGDSDYCLPSPPERDLSSLEDYSSYNETRLSQLSIDGGYGDGCRSDSGCLANNEYDDIGHLGGHHSHQPSYAQSEGYHSYVSSSDSTTTSNTPFIDRLRRESEYLSQSSGSGGVSGRGDSSPSSGSSSETLKWRGSLSDVSSSFCPAIARSSRIPAPQRHHSESVLYLGNSEPNNRRLFPVSTYEPTTINTHRTGAKLSVAERVNELERQAVKSTVARDHNELKAIQKKALLSFYERHHSAWKSEPQLSPPPPRPPPPASQRSPPIVAPPSSRRSSSASDYVVNVREGSRSSYDGSQPPKASGNNMKESRHQYSSSCGSLATSGVMGPMIVGPAISVDDWVPARPPKKPHLRGRPTSPEPPPPPPQPSQITPSQYTNDEPLPPPPPPELLLVDSTPAPPPVSSKFNERYVDNVTECWPSTGPPLPSKGSRPRLPPPTSTTSISNSFHHLQMVGSRDGLVSREPRSLDSSINRPGPQTATTPNRMSNGEAKLTYREVRESIIRAQQQEPPLPNRASIERNSVRYRTGIACTATASVAKVVRSPSDRKPLHYSRQLSLQQTAISNHHHHQDTLSRQTSLDESISDSRLHDNNKQVMVEEIKPVVEAMRVGEAPTSEPVPTRMPLVALPLSRRYAVSRTPGVDQPRGQSRPTELNLNRQQDDLTSRAQRLGDESPPGRHSTMRAGECTNRSNISPDHFRHARQVDLRIDDQSSRANIGYPTRSTDSISQSPNHQNHIQHKMNEEALNKLIDSSSNGSKIVSNASRMQSEDLKSPLKNTNSFTPIRNSEQQVSPTRGEPTLSPHPPPTSHQLSQSKGSSYVGSYRVVGGREPLVTRERGVVNVHGTYKRTISPSGSPIIHQQNHDVEKDKDDSVTLSLVDAVLEERSGKEGKDLAKSLARNYSSVSASAAIGLVSGDRSQNGSSNGNNVAGPQQSNGKRRAPRAASDPTSAALPPTSLDDDPPIENGRLSADDKPVPEETPVANIQTATTTTMTVTKISRATSTSPPVDSNKASSEAVNHQPVSASATTAPAVVSRSVISSTGIVDAASQTTPSPSPPPPPPPSPPSTVTYHSVPTQEEIDCERLSRHLASHLSPSHHKLHHLLAPGPDVKRCTDYVSGLFRLDVPRRLSPTTQTSETNGNSVKSNSVGCLESASEDSDSSSSRHEDGVSNGHATPPSPHSLGTLQQKKEELVVRLSRKLSVLRAEAVDLAEETNSNEALGATLAGRVSVHATPSEISRYTTHVQETGHITSLLLALSARLARVDNSILALPPSSSEHERKTLETKRDKLVSQLGEAKKLKANIDKRSQAVATMLSNYLTAEEYTDYNHFISMKCKLLVDSREVADKIQLGEEQLAALQEALDSSDSSISIR